MTQSDVGDCSFLKQKAFENQLEAHLPGLKRYARSLVYSNADAEDLLQDTALRALERREQFRAGTNLASWLCAIMHSIKVNGFRRQKIRKECGLDTIPLAFLVDEREDVEQIDQKEMLHDSVNAVMVLAGLSGDERDAIVVTKYLGLSIEEAAIALGVPQGTVKSRISRGLTRARDAIEKGEWGIYNISPWEQATLRVPRDNPYYPVARAYELLHQFCVMNAHYIDPGALDPLVSGESEVDKAWRELQESGALDGWGEP